MVLSAEQLAEYIRNRLQPSDRLHAEALASYVELIERYAPTLNLTGICGRQRLADELVLEALKLLELGEFPHGAAVADLGSGNGSPVVPLAACCPAVRFSAVEVRRRRAAFIATAKAVLDLENLEVHPYRAEELARRFPGAFDAVTARAFARPPQLLELALPLLKPGGEVRGFAGGDIAELELSIAERGLHGLRIIGYDHAAGRRHIWQALLN